MAPVHPPPIPHAPPGGWSVHGPDAPPPQAPPPPAQQPWRPARTWVAVTSLSVAVLALALAFVPWVKVLAVLLVLAALVGGVLVLVRRWRGRAVAITAVAVATVAALVATVLLVVGAVDLLRSRADEIAASAPTPPAPPSASPSPRSPSPRSPTPSPSASGRDPFTDPTPQDLYGEASAPGQKATIRDYDVTVSGVRPASGQLEGGDQVEYVAFDLTVVNTSDGVRDVSGDLGITILDQDLERYTEQRCADLLPPQTPRKGQPRASEVPPGATVSGTICEDVPAAVVPDAVLLISVSDGDRVSGSTWALGAGSDPAP